MLIVYTNDKGWAMSENYILRSFRFPLDQIDFLKTRRNASQWVRQAIEEKRLREAEQPGETQINLYKRKLMLDGKINEAQNEKISILSSFKTNELEEELEEYKQILDSIEKQGGLKLSNISLREEKIRDRQGHFKIIMNFHFADFKEPCELVAEKLKPIMDEFREKFFAPEYAGLLWHKGSLSEYFKRIKEECYRVFPSLNELPSSPAQTDVVTLFNYVSLLVMIFDVSHSYIESPLIEVFKTVFEPRIKTMKEHMSYLENEIAEAKDQQAVLKKAYDLKIEALISEKDRIMNQLLKL